MVEIRVPGLPVSGELQTPADHIRAYLTRAIEACGSKHPGEATCPRCEALAGAVSKLHPVAQCLVPVHQVAEAAQIAALAVNACPCTGADLCPVCRWLQAALGAWAALGVQIRNG